MKASHKSPDDSLSSNVIPSTRSKATGKTPADSAAERTADLSDTPNVDEPGPLPNISPVKDTGWHPENDAVEKTPIAQALGQQFKQQLNALRTVWNRIVH